MVDIQRFDPIVGQFSDYDSTTDEETIVRYNLVTLTNYIVLNLFPEDHFEYHKEFLKSIDFRCKRPYKADKNSSHKWNWCYRHEHLTDYSGKEMRICLFVDPIARKKLRGDGKVITITPRTGVTIKILYPTNDLINQLVKFYQSLTVMPNISEIEFTFDFYTEQRVLMRQFLETSKFTKYNRGTPFKYGDTSYAAKREKGKRQSKVLKTYPKDEDSIPGAPIRTEVTVKRTIIAREKLELPTLDTQIRNFDFQRFFDFRKFNVEEYARLWTERVRRAHYKKDMIANSRSTETWSVARSKELSQRHLDSNIDSYIQDENDGYGPRTLDGIVRALKDANEYTDNFINKLDEVNEDFFGKIKGRSFLL